VLLILLGNALKFINEGTITITVHLQQNSDGGQIQDENSGLSNTYLQVSVKDSGIGISQLD